MSIRYLDLSGAVNFWTNIKNYILSKIPTKTSELTNDSGFLTQHQSLSNYVTLNSEQTITGKKLFTNSTTKVNSVNTFIGSTQFIDLSTTVPRGAWPAEDHRVGRLYIGDGTSYNGAWFIVDPTITSTKAYYRVVTTNPDNTDSTRFSITWDSTKEGARRRKNVSQGDLLPSGNNTYNLGADDLKWDIGYIHNLIGSNKENASEDANNYYSTTSGSHMTFYTTTNGGTKLSNVPAAVNTQLESRTIRYLSASDWNVEQICHNTNGLYYRKGDNNGWGDWKTFAFTDSNITGTASNVTGTVAIANGGTGATTRLNAVKALTNEAVGTPTHFLTITTNYAKAGYTNIAQVKTVLGITGDIGSHSDSEYVHKTGDESISGDKNFQGLLTTIPDGTIWPVTASTTDDITYLGANAIHVEQKGSGKLTDLSGGAWSVAELGLGCFFFRINNGADIRYKNFAQNTVNRIPVVSNANRFINDVTPNADNTYDLGETSNKWKSVYANSYYLGTTAFGDIVTHNASEFLTQHPSITLSTNTTSTASPAHGGTFTCIDSVTQDTNGHITKVNTKTVTLPSDNNTDTKVKQYEGTTNQERPILSRYNSTEASQTANFVVYDTGVTSNPAKHTITASGGFVGNASSATEFSANQDVTLTGDVTGTASSKAGWSISTTLSDSGVTAGTYGPSADVTGNNNATILVPEITVDAKGRVTAVTNRTYKSVNTDSDKKVYQYYKSDDNVYRLLFSNNSGNTATSNVGAVYSGLNNSFYVNPSTGSLYATKLYSGGTEVSVSGHTHTKSEITDFPTNVSAFTNDSGYLTAHPTIAINSVPVSQPSVKLQNGDTFTYVSYVNRDANGHADTVYTTTATLSANIPRSIAIRRSCGTWTISDVPKGSLLYINGNILLNGSDADSYDVTLISGARMLAGTGMSDTMASAQPGNAIISNNLGMILLVNGTGSSGTTSVAIELSSGPTYVLQAYQ